MSPKRDRPFFAGQVESGVPDLYRPDESGSSARVPLVDNDKSQGVILSRGNEGSNPFYLGAIFSLHNRTWHRR
jgi:hypothetical protein